MAMSMAILPCEAVSSPASLPRYFLLADFLEDLPDFFLVADFTAFFTVEAADLAAFFVDFTAFDEALETDFLADLGICLAIFGALAPATPPTTAPTAAPIGPTIEPAAAPAAAPPTMPTPERSEDFLVVGFVLAIGCFLES